MLSSYSRLYSLDFNYRRLSIFIRYIYDICDISHINVDYNWLYLSDSLNIYLYRIKRDYSLEFIQQIFESPETDILCSDDDCPYSEKYFNSVIRQISIKDKKINISFYNDHKDIQIDIPFDIYNDYYNFVDSANYMKKINPVFGGAFPY